MKVYPEELIAHQKFLAETREVPLLNAEQRRQLARRAAELSKRRAASFRHHNLINALLLLGLWGSYFAINYLALPRMPGLLAVVALAGLSGFLSYSISVFLIHEGAGHQAVFRGGKIAKAFDRVATELCRVLFCDPIFYRSRHLAHHAHTGEAEDGAYTHFVWPRRFWLSVIPVYGALALHDYKIHVGDSWTASHAISQLLGLVNLGAIVWLAQPHIGWGLVLVFVLLSLSVSFTLDRLRESSEHNLMPAGNDGARSMGFGFWAMLVGGGPWGQPCHLAHHLFPGLPWYDQLRIHKELTRVLSPEQRAHYLVEGFGAYPKLLVRLLRDNHRLARKDPA